MFGFIKNLFNKPAEQDNSVAEESAAPEQPADHAMAPAAEAPFRPKFPGQGGTPAQAPSPARRPASNGNGVYLQLQSVLNGLPLELKSRVRQPDVGEATISIPLDKVLSQLQSGSVKITFGELRRAASQIFSSASDCDQTQVSLPLHEILARIDPAMLIRRQDQRQIEVPDDVGSPFGDRGQGLALTGAPGKAPAAPAAQRQAPPAAARVQPTPVQPTPAPMQRAPVPAPIPAPIQRAPVKTAPVQPAPIKPAPVKPAPIQPAAIKPAPVKPAPIQPAPVQRPPFQPAPTQPSPIQRTPIQPVPIQRTPVPPAPAKPAPVIQRTPTQPAQPAPLRGSITSTPTPPPPSTASPGAIPSSQALRGLSASLTPTPVPAQAAPRQVASRDRIPNPAEPAGDSSNSVIVPLAALAESWPEALRLEILQLNLVDARVALPAASIEDAMKRGKVAFQWKVLRSWVKPAPGPTISGHDNTVLDLSLKVITPLFLARQKESKTQQKVAVDENIPNLFFGFPQPDAAPVAAQSSPAPVGAAAAAPQSHAVTKPVDTNYYVWDDASDSAKVDETEFKRKPSPATNFLSRYATPNEVVSRAAALDGVAGALIALPDGLMVASRLAPDLNGDTLAAFLPHIFGKVSQCTKELRMGELNNLNFTVGNVPWKIFRVNAIFFATFGRVGQPLPTAQLAALAAELDHKKQ